MSQTRKFIRPLFPNDISDIVIGYFDCKATDPYERGLFGSYESCALIFDVDPATRAFSGACAGGWIQIIKCLESKGLVSSKYHGILDAATNGQLEVVNLFMGEIVFLQIQSAVFESALYAGHVNVAKHVCFENLVLSHHRERSILLEAYRKGFKDVIEFVKNRNSKSTFNYFLFDALVRVDIEAVKAISTNNIEYVDEYFEFTCFIGNISTVTCLMDKIEMEMDPVNSVAIFDGGFLCCCKNGYLEVLRMMLNRIPMNNNPYLLWLAFGAACQNNQLECVKLLCESRLDKNKVSLVQAYSSGNTEILKFVLESNWYNLDFFDGEVLIFHDNVEVTTLYLNFLRLDHRLKSIDVDISLETVCRFGNVNVLTLIVDVSNELQTHIKWDSHFIKACQYGNLEYVKAMIRLGNIRRFHEGLRAAKGHGHSEVVDYLETLGSRKRLRK
jgi:hypothetical protein